MSRDRLILGLVVALGAAVGTVVRLRRDVASASEAELDAAVAQTLAGLATIPADTEEGCGVAYICRAEQPPEPQLPWFWHVAASCPHCTQDPEHNTTPGLGSVVHEDHGWARSRRAAVAAANDAMYEISGLSA